MNFKRSLWAITAILLTTVFVGCDKDDEPENAEYDSTLYGEWVGVNDGKIYIHDYLYFSSNGTGEEGTYESDIDWVSVDGDFKWYTVDDEYLFINGRRYKYWCNGTRLEIKSYKGKDREYRYY